MHTNVWQLIVVALTTKESVSAGTTFEGIVTGVAAEGIIAMNPKQECIDSIVGEATERLQEARCTSTQASKIRGKCGWVGANSFAKIGRIGLAALKQRQYWDKSSAITEGGQLYDAVVPEVTPHCTIVWCFQ